MTVYCGGRCEEGHACCHGGMHYLAVTYLGMKSENFREHDVVCDVAQVVRERDRFKRVIAYIAEHPDEYADLHRFAKKALEEEWDPEDDQP